MTASLISYFKKKAKALKKAVSRGDAKAVVRAVAVIHGGTADFRLMKAQHVTAVEAGFGNWSQLIGASANELQAAIARDKAPDLARQIQAVLDQQPHLTVHGFWAPNTSAWRSEPHRSPEAIREGRAEFFGADEIAEVQAAMVYLDQLRPTRISPRNSPGSYGLKHDAERWHASRRTQATGHTYVSNGALIMAALIKGFAIKREDERSPNCLIGVNPREVQALSEGIDPGTLRVRPSPFVRWLFNQAGREDPVGDLASDAKEDLSFPRGGLEQVRGYLSHHGEHVMKALKLASAEWRQAK
jgi:hypothetical protein